MDRMLWVKSSPLYQMGGGSYTKKAKSVKCKTERASNFTTHNDSHGCRVAEVLQQYDLENQIQLWVD